MVTKIFSVYDEKAKAFGNPFFMVNKGMALRGFADLVSDKNTSVNRHPDDFKLYLVGEFDDNSGVLTPLAQPEFVANAVEFLKV